ncbi:MAG: aconitate hydratase AcnA [Acidobacteria bacterium]|nr:aconitate hydratase AcnA [Thermoanaerobaculia bacterium]MDI9631657.1 aconitate hydratase AcnA [Acidobacteriota bacterium]MBP7814205.1 aconitate hydratase AcnA [Thermoanaerobaculia bacterium]MBP8844296.1 aconitate hydratase AcnA [Thermoanaerobaculia bacterium]NLN11841.1 aconitate hydratase AcnA [Acidobacteriota bacterium]
MTNSFGSHQSLSAGGRMLRFASLAELTRQGADLARLPYALKILLENLLRREDGQSVHREEIEALLAWRPAAEPDREIAFMPARVLLQDFTGVPAVVDLAAMRDAMRRMGGDPAKINPLQPAELVIDHSVQVDEYGSAAAFLINGQKEFERNRERYTFLRWGQSAFAGFRVVPPSTGIVHQVNLEHLARVVMAEPYAGELWAYPDTLVGTDSHTTMVNGLGVLGWGVGGIEAEAAMLGQPIAMLIPQVIGVRLSGRLPEGATATDLVLAVTEMLRRRGVVGKFVEFFGPGLAELRLADRATIANMAPEYGATCGIFPVDQVALDYLAFTGRPAEQIALVEAYSKAQGLFHGPGTPEAEYTDLLTLDLGSVEPSLAGPRRPQDRVALGGVKRSFAAELEKMLALARPDEGAAAPPRVAATHLGESFELSHGAVVIAAITSCTNTSNPSVMLAAGLLAKKAVERGLRARPWVKTSLAPGSKVVTDYLREAGLTPYLEALRFHLVGYGCTTCIGNSGPLPPPVSKAIEEGQLVAVSVLSGNRNFEGRINAEVRANYLASPPLVVAYALAGRIDLDLTTEPLGTGSDGRPVYLREIWPSQAEIEAAVRSFLKPEMFVREYADVFHGDDAWRALPVPAGDTYAWEEDSTYVRRAPFFDELPLAPPPVADLAGARVLALFGDSITTDHISPAGAIKADSPAGRYLVGHGVPPAEFNSYGSRRGNHEVMVRGTFANIRLRNRLVPGVEGGFTRHLPGGVTMSIYDAAEQYRQEGVPLVILAGKEYGSGSSRDWAAKGPRLLGVRVVVAESFERIHRSNLIGMGILPLEFPAGESAASLGLTGEEVFAVEGIAAGVASGFAAGREVTVVARREDGSEVRFAARVRLDTPKEVDYYRHGGILQYVLRQLLQAG